MLMQVILEAEDAEKLRRLVNVFDDEKRAVSFSLGLFLFALRTDKLTLLRLSGLQPRSRGREPP